MSGITFDADGPPENAQWANVSFPTFRKQLKQCATIKEIQRVGAADEDITVWWRGPDHVAEPIDREEEVTNTNARPRAGEYLARVRDLDPARDNAVTLKFLRCMYRGDEDERAERAMTGGGYASEAGYLRVLETSAARRETQLMSSVEHADRRTNEWIAKYEELHAKYLELRTQIAEGSAEDDSGAEWIPTVELLIRTLASFSGMEEKERAVRRFFERIMGDAVLVKRLQTKHTAALQKLFAVLRTEDDEGEDDDDDDDDDDDLEDDDEGDEDELANGASPHAGPNGGTPPPNGAR